MKIGKREIGNGAPGISDHSMGATGAVTAVRLALVLYKSIFAVTVRLRIQIRFFR